MFRLIPWRAVTILLDLCTAYGVIYVAYALVFDFTTLKYVSGLNVKALAFAAICGFMMVPFGVHRSTWRYVSLVDTLNLIKMVTATVVVYTVGAFLISRGDNIPRSVIVLSTFLLLTGVVVPRLVYRLAVEGYWVNPLGGRRSDQGTRNVLVLGMTNGAESFIRTWRRTRNSAFYVAGILDSTEPARTGSVQGVKVRGSLNDLPRIMTRLEHQRISVSELVIAEPSPSRQRLSEIVQKANAQGLKITHIPDLTHTPSVTGSTLIDPKPIELRDLLGRPEVETDVEGVAALIVGQTVLATGAGGSIGSELVRQICHFKPKRLIMTDSSEYHIYMLDKEIRETFPELDVVTRLINVRDRRRLSDVFREFNPDVVFHAAALKHVPLLQDNPVEGIKTNVLGTRNVVDAAMACGVSTLIMISTDKAVNPTNVMGATKRAAEAYCQTMDLHSGKTRFKTVRFGNVLGSNGSVVPRFREQIAAGGPVTVTHPEIVRYFMTIPEAVGLVLHASSHALRSEAERGKIMVLDMGEPVRIVDLAERMIQLAGYRPHKDIEIVFTGLRPGEKLYEELFDTGEAQDARTKDGYVVASPRVVDRAFLLKTLDAMEVAISEEDEQRALDLLRHIVPEYGDGTGDAPDGTAAHHKVKTQAI